ncbi:MAG: cobalamin biosynthesis protein CobD [Ramlibacter sp.]|nr:cobalamin biosynthesis protein CobD [Ramlibacter sp.]
MFAHWCGLEAPGAALASMLAFALLVSMLIDRVAGEPRAALHPVVGMGRYLKISGDMAAGFSRIPAFGAGAVAWCAGAAVLACAAWLLQSFVLVQMRRAAALPGPGSALAALVLLLAAAWLLKCMLSWRMLREETAAVEAALAESLPAGRARLSWLVSRDTARLSASEVRESAIESLAENLNDSVVAPIFWFVLLGLPGAVVYRFANTADAMWGYRGHYRGRYWEWAGKWAARADDLLSWAPARITALLLALAAGGLPLSRLRSEAGRTPSPNSGWPMAAMAAALGVRLGKPGVYTLNPTGRLPQAADAELARTLASRVVMAAVAMSLAAIAAGAGGAAWTM